MKHIFLIVEGQSEEVFYKTIVAEHFKATYIFEVTIMPNKKNQTSRKYKGGTVTYDLCIKNIRRFLSNATHCEKLFLISDFYGLHPSFLENYSGKISSKEKANYIIQRIENEINNHKFSVFLQMHEFEAFLFSDPEKVVQHYQQEDTMEKLNAILSSFGDNPEDINDSVETSPSHRIKSLFPGYGKTTDGVIIAKKIGISMIAQKCPSFQEFIKKLQS